MKLTSVLFIVLQICVLVLVALVLLSPDDGKDFSLVGVAILVALIGACIAGVLEEMGDTPGRRLYLFCLVGPVIAGLSAFIVGFVEWLVNPSAEAGAMLGAVPAIFSACFILSPTWAAIGIGAFIRERLERRKLLPRVD